MILIETIIIIMFSSSDALSLTQSIDRGCATSHATAGCQSSTTSSVTTTSCITKGHRSNGYDVFAANGTLCNHYINVKGAFLFVFRL